MQAFTTLNFGDATLGRRKWQAVFTFDDSAGQAASNAKLAFDSGIPSITFSNVRIPPPPVLSSHTALLVASVVQMCSPGSGLCISRISRMLPSNLQCCAAGRLGW